MVAKETLMPWYRLRELVALLLLNLSVLVPATACQVSPMASPLESDILPTSLPEDAMSSFGNSPLAEPGDFAVPTPADDAAVVWGQIVDEQTGFAPPECSIALGRLMEMDSGVPVVSLHRDDAPVATPSTEGWFAIADVPPGEYGMVLVTPDVSFLLDNGKGGSLMLDLEAGDAVSLGQILVSMP